MLFNMPKITFFLRRNNDRAESHVIYCRVTFNNSKVEFSTKEKIEPSNWSQMNQCYCGKSKSKKQYTDQLLDTLKYKLKSLAIVHENLTAKELVAALVPAKVESDRLVDLIKKFIAAHEAKQAPGTTKNQNIKLDNLIDFEKHMKAQLTVSNFTVLTAEKFIEWFCFRAKTLRKTSANRNVLFFKQVLSWCQKKGMIKNFGLLGFSPEHDKLQRPVFLSLEDVKKLEETTFVNRMLNQVKDVFLFQCYSGLSYGDIYGLWEIKETEHGSVLIGSRAKNEQTFFVPISERVLAILEKYDFQLPKYANAVYNRILKEIACICEIEKRITTHTARKTFATLKDAEGWTRESVAAMLGHRSIKTTEMYYLGESFSRIENEMKKRKDSDQSVTPIKKPS